MEKLAVDEVTSSELTKTIMYAKQIAMAVVHNIYAVEKDEKFISATELCKVKDAVRILETCQRLTPGNNFNKV